MDPSPPAGRQVFCRNCQCNVTYHVKPVNHGTNLVLSVVTCGLWLPVWVLAALVPMKTCDHCGQDIPDLN